MNWKRKVLGIGSALMLSFGMIGPATADDIGSMPVSVDVSDSSTIQMSAGLASGSSAKFGNVPVDAVGEGNGLVNAGTAEFVVEYGNDVSLHRSGSNIYLKLGDGTSAGAYMEFKDSVPGYIVPGNVNLQIPGRYLSISGMYNPQQVKYTGGTGSSGQIWNGSTGRAPRVAGSADSGKAIYKVGDIGGAFGATAPSACRVTTDNTLVLWPEVCGANNFGEGNGSHMIAWIYEGSGFVSATHTVQLALQVPAGVYPGTYEGTLTVEQVFN